jgi:hypothetical protein
MGHISRKELGAHRPCTDTTQAKGEVIALTTNACSGTMGGQGMTSRCGNSRGRGRTSQKGYDMSDSTPRRRPLAKSVRFAVLERDGFRCQYCGATPQNGALEVDHIIPVADGGSSEMDNLITSCEPCNKGKSRKRIGTPVKPDLSAVTAEASRVASEVNKWRRAHKKLISTVSAAAEQIREQHDISIPHKMLENAIREYGIAEVDYAVDKTEGKVSGSDYKGQTSYMFAVLRNRRDAQAEPAPMPVFIKPSQVVTDSGCIFGGAGCPSDMDFCMESRGEDGYIVCTKLHDAVGGWERQSKMVAVAVFVEAFRNGKGLESLVNILNESEEAWTMLDKAGA